MNEVWTESEWSTLVTSFKLSHQPIIFPLIYHSCLLIGWPQLDWHHFLTPTYLYTGEALINVKTSILFSLLLNFFQSIFYFDRIQFNWIVFFSKHLSSVWEHFRWAKDIFSLTTKLKITHLTYLRNEFIWNI